MIHIYALCDPVDESIRYIGKTKDCKQRLLSHIAGARNLEINNQCAKWLRAMAAQGNKPTLIILRSIPDGNYILDSLAFLSDNLTH